MRLKRFPEWGDAPKWEGRKYPHILPTADQTRLARPTPSPWGHLHRSKGGLIWVRGRKFLRASPRKDKPSFILVRDVKISSFPNLYVSYAEKSAMKTRWNDWDLGPYSVSESAGIDKCIFWWRQKLDWVIINRSTVNKIAKNQAKIFRDSVHYASPEKEYVSTTLERSATKLKWPTREPAKVEKLSRSWTLQFEVNTARP